MNTRVAETGIACEACHGPAAAHVAAHANPVRRYLTRLRGQGDPTIVNPARLSRDAEVQVCTQCHGVTADVEHPRFLREGFSYRPGGDLQTTRYLLAPGDPKADRYLEQFEKDDPGFFRNNFWPDGMVRTTGREGTGMVRSACYTKGKLTCRSCHSPHEYADPDDQLTPAATGGGNEACFQCHGNLRTQVAAHTHHAPDSPGSQCYNCHMPFTSFGLLKATRSHQITRPVAMSTEAGGRPNACNLCHLDQTREWTARHLTDWYGQPAVELSDEDRTHSMGAMLALRGDAVQRAVAHWSMGWQPARAASGDDWQAAYLALGLSDSYSVVRYVAQKALRLTPGLADVDYDFAARPEAIEASQQKVIADLARALRPVEADKAARLFMRRNGALQTDRVAAQLDRRDNTPIEHKE